MCILYSYTYAMHSIRRIYSDHWTNGLATFALVADTQFTAINVKDNLVDNRSHIEHSECGKIEKNYSKKI